MYDEFNYFSAKRDIKNGKVQIIESGLVLPMGNIDWQKEQEAKEKIEKKFGYNVSTCIYTNVIRMYNNIMEDYLEKRNGKNWRQREQKMWDSFRNSYNSQ